MMTFIIFAGDMFVMAFMIALIVWVSVYANDKDIEAVARIPLEDDDGSNDG